MDDGHVDKRAKKCVIKQEIEFEGFKNYLENNKVILRSQQRFRSKAHNVFTEKVEKIAHSVNDNKRIQTPHRVATYSLGYALGKYAK